MEEHLVYKHLAETTTITFYDFIVKLENANTQIIGDNLMRKFREIDSVLQKLFAKCDEKPSIMSPRNERNKAPGIFEPQQNNSNKLSHAVKKSSDKEESTDDLFKKIFEFSRKEVMGADEDVETGVMMKPMETEDLFKTDYPDEIEVTSSAEVMLSVKKSRQDSPCKKSTQEATPIKKFREDDSANDDLDRNTGIFKITEDVYQCKLCNVSNLPRNNLNSHINGKSHKSAVRIANLEIAFDESKEEIEVSLAGLEDLVKTKDGLSLIVPGNTYSCTLCKSDINNKFSLYQHLQGAKHLKNLQLKAKE